MARSAVDRRLRIYECFLLRLSREKKTISTYVCSAEKSVVFINLKRTYI